MTAAVSLEGIDGLRWSSRGYATLSGPLHTLARAVESKLDDVAATWSADPLAFPPFLPVAELQRIDYFGSFPHLATFPVHLGPDEEELARFAAAPLGADGTAQLGECEAVREVLTPAACYHLYVHMQGEQLTAPRFFTTTATCYRRETHYRPLERQWAFTMREVVCMGTAAEVRGFLDEAREKLDGLAVAAGLPVRWEEATDPFFRPSKNPQYLMQRIDPTKHEAVFGDGLAIGSVNMHHDHFGRAFGIERAGEPVTTGCVAFGIERWLAAIVRQHGADAGSWPEWCRHA